MNNQELKTLRTLFRPPETPGSTFISLEGVEGSGKTTQIKNLEAYLKQKNYRVLTLREPGGTIFGEKLRSAVLESEVSLHPLAECHLFLAARAQLLTEKILPFLLTPGSVVIVDRYLDSSLAYQGRARHLGYETILTLHQFDPLNLIPHRTYFLDIDLEDSMKRQEHRGNKKDYFESQNQAFYQCLIDSYRELAYIFNDRILKVDARQSVDQVTQTLLQDIQGFLP